MLFGKKIKYVIMKKIFAIISFLAVSFIVSAQILNENDGLYYGKNGKLYADTLREHYADGSIKFVINIVDGKKDGIGFFYSTDGKKEQQSYKLGIKDGLWINWNETGVKIAEARYKNGSKNGFWHVWDTNGQKRYEMFYENGQKKGTWFMWDEAGKLTMERKYD